MKFFKKRSVAWTILALTIVCCYFLGMNTKPSDEIHILPSGVYVQDNANVLSESTEDMMTKLNNGLVSKVGAEIQVVTINTVGGEDIFDVAIDYAINTNLSANCCVFLIAVEDIDAVIVQGDDLIYDFTDDELSYILQKNFTVKEFESRKLDSGAIGSFNDLIKMYEKYYNVSITGSTHIEYMDPQDPEMDMFLMILTMVIILIIAIKLSRPRRRTVFVPVGRTVRTVRTYTNHRPNHTPPRPNGGFTSSRGGSFTSSSSRSGGFGSSSRGSSFSSSSSRSSSRSGGFGGSSRGGSFGGGGSSRGGGFRK